MAAVERSRAPAGEPPDLARYIRPGDTVLWGQTGAQPMLLTRALLEQRHSLQRIKVFLGIGSHPYPSPVHADAIDFMSYAGGGTNRALAREGLLDIWPCHYSRLPGLIRSGQLKIDVVLLQVAEADEHGRYSLGMAHEYVLAALDRARVVIGEIQPDAPWTFGERYLSARDFAWLGESRDPLPEPADAAPGLLEQAIGRNVADLIEDGATLQVGIGVVPDAVLSALGDRRDLGVHSGAIGDGVARLAEAGVITNARKTIDMGTTVAGVLMGGRRVRAFAHRNPQLQMRGTEYTHDARVLGALRQFVSLNSAIEVDLTGQVNAEVAGGVYMGAVGGALDFTRAAHASPGGLPLFALPSTVKDRSRIVATLSGPVTTPRSDAGIVVTEHGVADLRQETLSGRVRKMISIAHPVHREALEKQAAAGLPLR